LNLEGSNQPASIQNLAFGDISPGRPLKRARCGSSSPSLRGKKQSMIIVCMARIQRTVQPSSPTSTLLPKLFHSRNCVFPLLSQHAPPAYPNLFLPVHCKTAEEMGTPTFGACQFSFHRPPHAVWMTWCAQSVVLRIAGIWESEGDRASGF
jgi:hypothetical protein